MLKENSRERKHTHARTTHAPRTHAQFRQFLGNQQIGVGVITNYSSVHTVYKLKTGVAFTLVLGEFQFTNYKNNVALSTFQGDVHEY